MSRLWVPQFERHCFDLRLLLALFLFGGLGDDITDRKLDSCLNDLIQLEDHILLVFLTLVETAHPVPFEESNVAFRVLFIARGLILLIPAALVVEVAAFVVFRLFILLVGLLFADGRVVSSIRASVVGEFATSFIHQASVIIVDYDSEWVVTNIRSVSVFTGPRIRDLVRSQDGRDDRRI